MGLGFRGKIYDVGGFFWRREFKRYFELFEWVRAFFFEREGVGGCIFGLLLLSFRRGVLVLLGG